MQFHLHQHDTKQPTWMLITSQQLDHLKSQADFAPLATLIDAYAFKADFNEVLTGVNSQGHIVYLLGLGDSEKLDATKTQKLATTIVKNSQNKHEAISVDCANLAEKLQPLLVQAISQANYVFDENKSEKSKAVLNHVDFVNAKALTQNDLDYCKALHQGQSFARDLGNRPGNVCIPAYLAEQAIELGKQYPELLKVTVLETKQIQALGMNAFLAVAQGSVNEGRVITLEYKAAGEQKPVVLVGKGITFDTGGISIKPAASMDEMRFDMCGAASVLGVMRALCEAKLPINVVGAIAAAENMPSGNATRPGDVVKSMSGQTIEILNTDAEGRLVLCDTLTYVKRFEPELVIDIATLTGACVVALGKVYSGLFCDDEQLTAQLRQAGEQSHDRVWHMPMAEDYQDGLKSNFADMANIAGPYGGAITAACFLKRFTKDYTWAHLDIAGSAWLSGDAKGATGRPVPMLMQFLANRAKKA
ncbi:MULTISPECIES: leucyl aminopeptidase [unclassified Acinetobacter]|uniref:leucyl aminopeptidase n=1 Tax=unclassified Acinetobacter TaxID=196816 RepID=UPI0035BA1843